MSINEYEKARFNFIIQTNQFSSDYDYGFEKGADWSRAYTVKEICHWLRSDEALNIKCKTSSKFWAREIERRFLTLQQHPESQSES